MSRIFLEVEKVQVSHLVEDLGSQTGIPNGLEKKNSRMGGVNNFGIWGAWGVEHFGISRGIQNVHAACARVGIFFGIIHFHTIIILFYSQGCMGRIQRLTLFFFLNLTSLQRLCPW